LKQSLRTLKRRNISFILGAKKFHLSSFLEGQGFTVLRSLELLSQKKKNKLTKYLNTGTEQPQEEYSSYIIEILLDFNNNNDVDKVCLNKHVFVYVCLFNNCWRNDLPISTTLRQWRRECHSIFFHLIL
jgi:hypothetical protein